jgi:hypothetical protein
VCALACDTKACLLAGPNGIAVVDAGDLRHVS